MATNAPAEPSSATAPVTRPNSGTDADSCRKIVPNSTLAGLPAVLESEPVLPLSDANTVTVWPSVQSPDANVAVKFPPASVDVTALWPLQVAVTDALFANDAPSFTLPDANLGCESAPSTEPENTNGKANVTAATMIPVLKFIVVGGVGKWPTNYNSINIIAEFMNVYNKNYEDALRSGESKKYTKGNGVI